MRGELVGAGDAQGLSDARPAVMDRTYGTYMTYMSYWSYRSYSREGPDGLLDHEHEYD